MHLSSLVCALPYIVTLTAALSPYVVEWNTTRSYGPDGPWQAVTVQVGTRKNGNTASWIDLLPATIYGHKLLTKSFCNSSGNANPCLAETAGLYDSSISTTAVTNFTDEAAEIIDWTDDIGFNITGRADNVMDGVTQICQQDVVTVTNSTIAAVDSYQIQLSDGTNYTSQIGHLSLGIPGGGADGTEGYTDINGNDAPNLTSWSIPGDLRNAQSIASNSFSLHYGSVSLGLIGSLVWGGYDKSRVLGTTGMFDLGAKEKMITSLLDIEVGVENGPSPFASNSSMTGLLKSNANLQGDQQVSINPELPYLYLSPATCTAIAQFLPVTLNSNIGLYTWNTADPQFQIIVNSPAYLAFVISNAGAGNLTIKVPFKLLNLTLDAPIVSTPQPYFPCYPLVSADNEFVLGRAFLQAALIGVNWESAKWFIGQAPGI